MPHFGGDDVANEDLCTVWWEIWRLIDCILPEDTPRLALDGERYSREEFDQWYAASAPLVWRHAAART
eukprot:8500224-Alexandrium_andersonii.AAC.1